MSQKYTLLTFKGSCMNFLLELKYFVLSHPVTSKQLHKIIQIHMRHPVEISWNQEPSLFYSTGCLNMLCNTSNQHFFRLKWYSKQELFIFGILSREDLCMDNHFLGCLTFTASIASNLKDAIFLMIQWRKTCLIFCS